MDNTQLLNQIMQMKNQLNVLMNTIQQKDEVIKQQNTQLSNVNNPQFNNINNMNNPQNISNNANHISPFLNPQLNNSSNLFNRIHMQIPKNDFTNSDSITQGFLAVS